MKPFSNFLTARPLAALATCFAASALIAPRMASAQTAAPQPAPNAKAKPNVLFIVSDDLNTDLGCYGHPLVKTPNIDRLAARGVRFDQAYCQYPVCNPSRASFLSGLRPESARVMDNVTPPRQALPDAVFLPQMFRNNNYFVANSGKTFHYVYDDKASWDISESGNGPKIESLSDLLRASRAGEAIPGVSIGKATSGQDIFWAKVDLPDEKMGDGIISRRVAEWMEEGSKGAKPWFLAAGFRKPHMPLNVPRKYFDLYDVDKITYPIEPPAHLAALPPIARRNAISIVPLEDQARREAIQAYYASISFMDAQVGILLDQMDRLKMWDNTVVVFFSDHGFQLGEHGGLWQKMVMFQESARVPLIIAAPGAKAGAVSPAVVELIDLYPTLAQLTGLQAPANLEGTSLVPLLSDPNREWKKAAFSVIARGQLLGRSVNTARYRYTEWDQGRQGVELYDHASDPREYKNLAADPAHAATIAEMKRLMTEARISTITGASAVKPNVAPTDAGAKKAPRGED